MNFDHAYKPNRENLAPATAALMDAVFFKRRALGLNVQFDNDGILDEWSFDNADRRDRFVAKLTREQTQFALVQS